MLPIDQTTALALSHGLHKGLFGSRHLISSSQLHLSFISASSQLHPSFIWNVYGKALA
jgi:hypothetical protein